MADGLRGVVEDFETGGPATSGEYARAKVPVRRQVVRPLSEISDSFERERSRRAGAAASSPSTAAEKDESGAGTSPAPDDDSEQRRERDPQRRATVAGFAVQADSDIEGPPTVDLTGLSIEEEEEALARAFDLSSNEEE